MRKMRSIHSTEAEEAKKEHITAIVSWWLPSAHFFQPTFKPLPEEPELASQIRIQESDRTKFTTVLEYTAVIRYNVLALIEKKSQFIWQKQAIDI